MFETLLEYLSSYFTPKNDSKIPLFSKFSQVQAFLRMDTKKTFAFLHSNRKDIHQILYDNDQMIKLNSEIADKNLSDLFYIILLIKDQADLMNYFYEFNFIEKVNKKRKKSKNSLTNFILAMIIIELINNFKGTELYDEENDSVNESLNQIYEENINIRDDAKNELSRMNLKINEEYIEENMISEIYIEIIKSLIENKKLDNYEHCSDILNQIGLNEIELTENMYNELLEIFNNNEEYISYFKLFQLEDLFNEQKINFFMTIFKYVLKDSFYLYNFSFLISARNDFLKIIKLDSNNKLSKYINNRNDTNSALKEKVSFVVKKFCDSEYYISKYLNHKMEEIMEVLKYLKAFRFIEKANELNNLENYLSGASNLTENDLNEYLKDFNEAKELNERKDIIYFLFEEGNKKNNKNKQKELEKYIKKMKDCEKMIKDGKFIRKMRNDDKILFYKYLNNKNNNDIALKIFSQEQIYSFLNNIEQEDKIKNKENSLCKNMIEDKPNQDKVPTEESEKKGEIIGNIKKIGSHKESAESIIKTKNGKYISMGGSSLLLFDENYEKIDELRNTDIYTGLNEIEKDNKETEVIATTQKELSIVKIDGRKLKSRNDMVNLPSLTKKSCLSIDNRNHILFCEEGVYHIKDLFSQILSFNSKKICNENCIGGILISKDLTAFASNKNIEGGKDSIIFYNPYLGKKTKEIEGYSFIDSINGLRVLNSEGKNMLLCSCKSKESKRNGILLINTNYIQNDNNKGNIIEFSETGNLEVYTFCPLSICDNVKTDFFLVGGFNKIKEKGEIKLYKYERSINKIKFVSNLEIDKNNNEHFQGFNGIVKCMIQAKDEKIIATCSDGNVYLFSLPNLEYYESIKNKYISLKILKN